MQTGSLLTWLLPFATAIFMNSEKQRIVFTRNRFLWMHENSQSYDSILRPVIHTLICSLASTKAETSTLTLFHTPENFALAERSNNYIRFIFPYVHVCSIPSLEWFGSPSSVWRSLPSFRWVNVLGNVFKLHPWSYLWIAINWCGIRAFPRSLFVHINASMKLKLKSTWSE